MRDSRLQETENGLAGKDVAVHRRMRGSWASPPQTPDLPGHGLRGAGRQNQREQTQKDVDGAPTSTFHGFSSLESGRPDWALRDGQPVRRKARVAR
jgi:hypothetical protein